jgi:phosphoenolpyruvate carboxykinase (ATP)
MIEFGKKNPLSKLSDLGICSKIAHWNLPPDELINKTIELNQGVLSDKGALCVNTGKFTGRSPKDKFTVKDAITENTVEWGDVNIPVSSEVFDNLYTKMCDYLNDKEIWVRDVYACADPDYRLNIRVVNETPWANLFCYNLFLRPKEVEKHVPDWLILQVPGFKADPEADGTRQDNFTIVNFSRKIILIGGSAYTGEMKKGIFSVLNFLLPYEHKVLSMHCSANEGREGDVALFFGLSGTGKTTLSTDPERALIGDDEHAWASNSVFNFEGGCYAKVIGLNKETEPDIYKAIRKGALLENVKFYNNTNQVNFEDSSLTENTRVAYPINFIENAKLVSLGPTPKNIFFLTCDAFGILPPISKLTKDQAMFHFISGYTAKVAGTEVGISEPQTTFSACFGRVFLPLHPMKYAELLGKKLEEDRDVNVWLVNTGWIYGPYGTGKRISLKYTRAMICAAIKGKLKEVSYSSHPVFGLLMPETCPEVPEEILNPRNSWTSKELYDLKANELATLFVSNFNQYADNAGPEILKALPKVVYTSV